MSKKVVLLLGATGLFGSLLAQRLLREERFDLVCAGRNQETLKAFCDKFGGRYVRLDRDDTEAVEKELGLLKPFATVDCAGPFQAYGEQPYRFAKAVIEAGSHYLDIADASDFVKEFSQLNELAKNKSVTAFSGASSTPAISSTVADALVKDMKEVESLTTVIIPGNRAKRTLSVMRSILSQIGKPMRVRKYGEDRNILGWAETEQFNLTVDGKREIKGRLASFVNTPDVAFFPDRYQANSVSFKAGLELKLFHYALSIGRWLVGKGIVKSLEPYSKFFRWLASWFEWMGSDAGGMKVSVLGKMPDGHYKRLEWDLIADDGHGPNIPTVPVSILLNKLLEGNVATGARACLGEVSLEEIETALAAFGGKMQVHSSQAKPIFMQALGKDFDELFEPIQKLHLPFGKHVYAGRANIKGPTGLMGRMASFLVGFPKDMTDTPVKVTITADEKAETWVREFGEKSFYSHLSVDEGGYIQEQFGPLHIRLGLKVSEGRLLYPVIRGRLFGFIPFPMFLMPQSISYETVDDEGRFVFDVLLKFRFGGRIAHYQGWLTKHD